MDSPDRELLIRMDERLKVVEGDTRAIKKAIYFVVTTIIGLFLIAIWGVVTRAAT